MQIKPIPVILPQPRVFVKDNKVANMKNCIEIKTYKTHKDLSTISIPTILVCNIRSLAPKIDELGCVINLNSADVICVTETWLSEEISDSYVSLLNFSLFRKDRTTRGGGIAMYVKSSIQCKTLDIIKPPDMITEYMWIQLRPTRLPRQISSILIGVIYHPPRATADDNNMLYDYIQNTVDTYLVDHPDSLVCIVVDFNPNSTHVSQRRFKHQCGLSQIVEVLTRDTGTLDWCLTNLPKLMALPKQLPKIGSSDHYCFLIKQSPVVRPINDREVISRPDTRDSRIRDFGQWITSFSWQEVYEKNTCQSKFESFHHTLTEAIEKYLPSTTVQVHSSDKPWINCKIKSWINKRQKSLARYGKQSPRFKFWRNKVQHAIKQAKSLYYDTKIRKLKSTNANTWWKEVKNLCGLADRNGSWFQHFIDGDTIDSIDRLCERVNEILVGLTTDFTPLSMQKILDIPVEWTEIPEELFVSTGEAYKSLCRVKIGKASGPDGIPNIVLKTFAFELAPVIADIYNTSLCKGYLPPLLKSAAVIPIPKKCPVNDIEKDIRPISLTCQIAKVMEGFTLTRILPTILPQLDNKQFAVAGKSTEQAIVYILHLALEALDKGNCSLRLFFADFSKGFDLIDHRILMEKLSKFNIHNSLLRWIGAFLMERSQFVRIGNYIVSDIQTFACHNNMKLNPEKCKEIIVDFLQYNATKWQPISINGKQVEVVTVFKLLGVYLSSDLTWTAHC